METEGAPCYLYISQAIISLPFAFSELGRADRGTAMPKRKDRRAAANAIDSPSQQDWVRSGAQESLRCDARLIPLERLSHAAQPQIGSHSPATAQP